MTADQRVQERVIVFSSPEQLHHLAMADRWFMDGNFSMSLSQFQQLYLIRAPLGTSAVSCVYTLLSGMRHLLKSIIISVGTILKIENRSISIDFRAENRDFDFCQSIFFQKKIIKKKYSAWNQV